MMTTGEIGYDELMHNSDREAYYKVGFVFLVLLVITMTIVVTNLLISRNYFCPLGLHLSSYLHNLGLAVSVDIFYELTADFEILKYALVWVFNRCCKCAHWHPWHYQQKDFKKEWKWRKQLKKHLLKSCAREADKNEESNESEDEDTDYPTHVLEELREGIRHLPKQQRNTEVTIANPALSKQGTTPKTTYKR
jgi:hypothetical protein